MTSTTDDSECKYKRGSKRYETDLVGLNTLRNAKRAIDVIMPRELVRPLKEHTPTLNPVLLRKIEVVLARLAVAVRVICPFPSLAP